MDGRKEGCSYLFFLVRRRIINFFIVVDVPRSIPVPDAWRNKNFVIAPSYPHTHMTKPMEASIRSGLPR